MHKYLLSILFRSFQYLTIKARFGTTEYIFKVFRRFSSHTWLLIQLQPQTNRWDTCRSLSCALTVTTDVYGLRFDWASPGLARSGMLFLISRSRSFLTTIPYPVLLSSLSRTPFSFPIPHLVQDPVFAFRVPRKMVKFNPGLSQISSTIFSSKNMQLELTKYRRAFTTRYSNDNTKCYPKQCTGM